MPKIKNIIALIRLGMIDPRLMALAWNIRRSKRTYLSFATLHSLAASYGKVHKRIRKPFAVAEFGVGRGGSALLLAWLVNRDQGHLFLYDVFGRIPPPTELDGDKAKSRYATITSNEQDAYYGNLAGLEELVRQEISKICKPGLVDFIQGKYEDILPTRVDKNEFSMVHIDCDWYESSAAVYRYLQTRLAPGAVIQVDDYSSWDGSRRAYEEAGWLREFPTHLVDGVLVINTSVPT